MGLLDQRRRTSVGINFKAAQLASDIAFFFFHLGKGKCWPRSRGVKSGACRRRLRTRPSVGRQRMRLCSTFSYPFFHRALQGANDALLRLAHWRRTLRRCGGDSSRLVIVLVSVQTRFSVNFLGILPLISLVRGFGSFLAPNGASSRNSMSRQSTSGVTLSRSLSSLLPVSLWPPFQLGMRFSLYGASSVWVRASLRVILKYVATDALNYAKAPGPSGDRGEFLWRALRWCVPPWPGCTSFRQVPVQLAVPGAAGHNRWGRTRVAAFNRVSFKPERAFNVIARDWEHAETVRRIRTVRGFALHAECTGPGRHVGESAPGPTGLMWASGLSEPRHAQAERPPTERSGAQACLC